MDDKLYYIWQKDESLQLSKNFSSKELQCKCRSELCKEQRISKQLVEKLQQLRDELKVSLLISSGYRCVEHNKAIGGAGKSNHCQGLAIDIADGPGQPINALVTEELLIKLDLYKEDPSRTRTWVHIQTPKTSQRIFKP